MPERPNILLIVFDTARADAFEPYGAPAGSSPAFADLASRGFAHEAAYANASWTVPSHAALFTGLLPADVGLLQAPGSRPDGCRPELERRRGRMLQSVLGEAGYRTGAVSSNLWIGEQTGFDIGFESFNAVDTRRQAEMTEDDLSSKARWMLEGVRARVDDGAAEAGRALGRFLDDGGGDERPFYCFVNLVEAHSPYLPPRPYTDLGPLGRGLAAIEARRHLTMGEIWRACAGGFDVPEAALERMRRLYAAAVRLLDDWLAAVLEDLDRRGILDETIVIVTSDHGENFGEGGLMGHAYSLDERLVRLPFAATGPLPPPDGPFTLASLPALLCEAAGVGRHPYSRAPGEPGVVVSQFDPPAGPEDPRVGKALELWGLPEEAGERITARLRSAGDGGRWKLVTRDGRELLHDLGADPLEERPIPTSAPDLPADAPLAALRAALEADDGDREPPPPPPAPADAVPPPSGDISEEERAKLEERMKLLGYL